ncbi:cadherin-like domain-containing protein, partial [Nitrosomonas sp. Is37]|uniref:cadherin-like domain-containing protein n=1 Tax=Nitrosomonas sp. Is37 TaxID=3080535 RepID=UPI00294AC9E1
MSNKKNKEINGSNGNDNILGTADADLINGNNGDDSITAGAGDDFVHGNNGNDVIEGGAGNDKIYGNAGIDTAIFSGSIFDYGWVITQDDGEGESDGDHPDWFEGKVTITDLNTSNGDDGIDTLKHVERLQFNDYVFNVVGNNAPLLIAADSQATDEDTLLTFSLSAFDFDGDAVTTSIVAASGASVSETGSSSLTPNMGSGTEFTFSYNPGSLFQHLAVGETADDQVTIEVSDGNGGVSTKVIDITITGVNDAPTGAATAALADGTEDTPYIVSAADLLAGFNDVDTSDMLKIAGLIASDGTVTDNLNGTFTITPTQNFNG